MHYSYELTVKFKEKFQSLLTLLDAIVVRIIKVTISFLAKGSRKVTTKTMSLTDGHLVFSVHYIYTEGKVKVALALI